MSLTGAIHDLLFIFIFLSRLPTCDYVDFSANVQCVIDGLYILYGENGNLLLFQADRKV